MQKITLVMLASQILALLGFATYPVALMAVQSEWALNNFQSGFIASSFFLGYVLVVPFATNLTDRIDAKKIYLIGCALSAIGLLGFGLYASNFLQACFMMSISGAGFASLYMPGLKIISDRLQSSELSRSIAFYTAFFGIGTGLSYLISGLLIPHLGWRWVFMGVALGPLFSFVITYVYVKKLDKAQQNIELRFSDMLPIQKWVEVTRDPRAVQYIMGYGIHCLELFASRNWIVAYLIFCGLHGQSALPLAIPAVAGIINFIGVPSSIIGNEIAGRIGRLRWVYVVMTLSFVSAVLLSMAYEWSWWIILSLAVLHMIFIMADSSTLTAGLVLSAKSEIKGAAMGLHSLVGFIGGLIGPALFGFFLDWAKSSEKSNPWSYAYLSIVILSVVYVFFYLMRSLWFKKIANKAL
jgi:MFS family permease